MYADKQSRGGILEPPGICEVKYRSQEQKIAMHRLDPTLIELDDLLVWSNLLFSVPFPSCFVSSLLCAICILFAFPNILHHHLILPWAYPPCPIIDYLTPKRCTSVFLQNTDAGGIYTRPSGVNSDSIAADIKNREKNLAPLYTQIAHEFADLHDRCVWCFILHPSFYAVVSHISLLRTFLFMQFFV